MASMLLCVRSVHTALNSHRDYVSPSIRYTARFAFNAVRRSGWLRPLRAAVLVSIMITIAGASASGSDELFDDGRQSAARVSTEIILIRLHCIRSDQLLTQVNEILATNVKRHFRCSQIKYTNHLQSQTNSFSALPPPPPPLPLVCAGPAPSTFDTNEEKYATLRNLSYSIPYSSFFEFMMIVERSIFSLLPSLRIASPHAHTLSALFCLTFVPMPPQLPTNRERYLFALFAIANTLWLCAEAGSVRAGADE